MRVEVRVAQLELMSKLKIKYPLLEKIQGNTRPNHFGRRDSLDTNFTEISFPSIENLEKNSLTEEICSHDSLEPVEIELAPSFEPLPAIKKGSSTPCSSPPVTIADSGYTTSNPTSSLPPKTLSPQFFPGKSEEFLERKSIDENFQCTESGLSTQMGGYDSLDDFETDSRSSHTNAPAEANRSHLASAAKSNVGKHKKKKASNTSLNTSNYTKLDPVTARILSAQKKKRNQTQNAAGQIRIRNQQLENELKSLRIQCIRQEKALSGFENTQSALPQVLQQYEDDKRVLKDRLRKAKESERRLERDKKRLEDDKHRQDRKIKDLHQKVKAGHLDERFELQQKLTAAEQAAEQALIELDEARKNARLQLQALERELKKETRRRLKAESSAQASTDEVERLRGTIKEKERQLGVQNIYSQKKKAKSHNVSLALEPSASPRPYSKRDERPVQAFTTPLPAASSPRPQSQPKTFMTEPEETKISLVAKPEPVVEQREPTPEPSPVPPTPPAPAQTSNDILDDLLGLNTKKEKDPSPLPPASPQLLDLPVTKEDKKIPNFFDDEPDEQKDDILADLRDLHARAPEKPEPEKKNNILNIFDDVPEPKIDPKEKKQQSVLDDIFGDSKKDKEVDDLDAFLGIKSEKKNQRKEYSFTPSVNNLHDGKAANGYEPAPKKKENLIDNLFGTTGTSPVKTPSQSSRKNSIKDFMF